MFDAFVGLLEDAVHVLVLLFGVGFVWQAATLVSHQRTLSRLETNQTGAVEGGLVAVEGEVRGPVEDGLVSPIRRENGVLAKWAVKEYAGHEAGTGGGWTEFGSGYETVPFVVDDGSGPVVVEIDGEESLRKLEIDLEEFEDDPALELDVTERPPKHVREFLATHDVREQQSETSVPTSEDGDEQGDRRYYETVLDSGDEVYVVGNATRYADTDSAATAVLSPSADGSGTFYLTDRGRSAVLRGRIARATLMGVLGVLLVWYELGRFAPGVQFVQF
ncbi:GIDE domain-containing protein [Halorussus salinisoli]|uniref:GIDE domain-containing protein n=1 Tax=Halorussus salinisoli TaxID=2558242 RepID=UPI001484F695|nr:GIDE domain-containing protein [Halorussus salinisoli]